MDEMKTRIRRVLKDQLGIENIPDDKVFYSKAQDTGVVPHYSSDELDSLDMVEFAMAIEEEFSIEIPDAIANQMVTVDAAAAAVNVALTTAVPAKASRDRI